ITVHGCANGAVRGVAAQADVVEVPPPQAGADLGHLPGPSLPVDPDLRTPGALQSGGQASAPHLFAAAVHQPVSQWRVHRTLCLRPRLQAQHGEPEARIYRSEEHTSELQSREISYAVFCLKKQK